MDDQNKNLILATALSFLVILVWFVLFPPEEPSPNAQPPELPVSSAPIAGSSTPAPATATTAPSAPGATAADASIEDMGRIAIDTPRLDGAIALAGGRIDTLRLKDYRQTIEPDSPEVSLLRPTGEEHAYYALFGWAPGGSLGFDAVPGARTPWRVEEGETLAPGSPVTLVWDNGAGLVFRRTIAVDEDYMFTVTQSVTNTSGATVRLAPYGLVARHGLPPDLKNFFILHEGLIQMADGTLTEADYDDIADYPYDETLGARAEVTPVERSGWIGFTDHYWMTTLIPDQQSAFRAVAKYDARRDIYQAEAIMPARDLANGETASSTIRFFAGAKEWETIRRYQNEEGVERFVDSIDWGWFFFLTKPIFMALHWLNKLIGNMGWAIIGLTVIIKAILFPLAYKSYVSMAKMKELQPEMEKIKERAGDDRQKLQQEMMALYRKEKVNPASGCLPILLQIPIFFSLYKVIFVTLELRHAPWILWIRDLSAPDPTSWMNLFGLLPWDAPGPDSILYLFSIGALPIVLGITMWLQQKLNPAPADPTQAMIFAWMPWIFMFMLGHFASGLILYWIANNTLTFIQQYTIMRMHGYKPDVFGNILASFRRNRKANEDKPAGGRTKGSGAKK
ncbi:YidC/Oxa1 family membrane protein insertase [Meinhardsimonia xiamenensis]|jgi:YidC/Oxa1 family membrane protein insertase|uniref:Membrane protein insertase YidC n=1 Tax=Meinhardsimonia xiamenensis TaxID=990712 RepID=A0A1G9EBZ5_9RHOB|nr:membrane protein insertase YidC [Meinhardsimonia xiamenensis]PRX33841.1 protein translocase subunit yidC [Meinhardsimonia xiamenensis]SDK73598.1 YidC/Oxa1 family membrane protein insertase [Meinhardsimonia xiamenensis]